VNHDALESVTAGRRSDPLECLTVAREQAAAALRLAIQSGDLAPGQRLVEAELAESLRVTRASIRLALLDLTTTGLVERSRTGGRESVQSHWPKPCRSPSAA
jgi:DNA-binding GntR family transcriptional regulator